ncbi:MAG: hypothetical protein FWD60_02040 [Candidatus Azobacteroides sp.]|nr:hypothetical protein [Candidatus Azobacteroides sp.]
MNKEEVEKNNVMDIQKIISNYHNASISRKAEIRKNLKKEFFLLTESEKKEVHRLFLESQEAVIQEGREALHELKLKTELEQGYPLIIDMRSSRKDNDGIAKSHAHIF